MFCGGHDKVRISARVGRERRVVEKGLRERPCVQRDRRLHREDGRNEKKSRGWERRRDGGVEGIRYRFVGRRGIVAWMGPVDVVVMARENIMILRHGQIVVKLFGTVVYVRERNSLRHGRRRR